VKVEVCLDEVGMAVRVEVVESVPMSASAGESIKEEKGAE
jgi:hypothetical protein